MTSDNTENRTANDHFQKNVEAFIEMANEFSHEDGMDMASSSMLYAAARFSAYNAARKYEDSQNLIDDKEEANKYFTEIFKQLYQQNMEEYIEHFDEYFKKS